MSRFTKEELSELELLPEMWEQMDLMEDMPTPFFRTRPEKLPQVPLVFLDIETSGLDPDSHGMVGIGAFAPTAPWNWFYCRCKVWEHAWIDEEALKVNGCTVEHVSPGNPNRLDELEAVRLFRDWLGEVFAMEDRIMVAGWNCHFDVAWMRPRMKSVPRYVGERFISLNSRVVDLHSLVAAGGGELYTTLTSDGASHLMGIPPEPRPHGVGSGMAWGFRLMESLDLIGEGRVAQ
jgi:hypothetical protein